MTLKEAVKIINCHKLRGFGEWEISEEGEFIIGWRHEDFFDEFEAIAIAEKYQNDRQSPGLHKNMDCVNFKRERDGILSEVADVARRIGPAALPEWVRDQLEEIVNRHQKWREVEFRAQA